MFGDTFIECRQTSLRRGIFIAEVKADIDKITDDVYYITDVENKLIYCNKWAISITVLM
jgi:hypothetical protein